MSYLTPRSTDSIPPDLLQAVAGLLGLTLPTDDLPGLTRALADQLASIDLFDSVDLEDCNPIVEFDPRWR